MVENKDTQLKTARVIGVKGFVVEVEFMGDNKPEIRDIVILEENDQVKMQVFRSSSKNKFYCLCLTNVEEVYRGAKVVNTQRP